MPVRQWAIPHGTLYHCVRNLYGGSAESGAHIPSCPSLKAHPKGDCGKAHSLPLGLRKIRKKLPLAPNTTDHPPTTQCALTVPESSHAPSFTGKVRPLPEPKNVGCHKVLRKYLVKPWALVRINSRSFSSASAILPSCSTFGTATPSRMLIPARGFFDLFCICCSLISLILASTSSFSWPALCSAVTSPLPWVNFLPRGFQSKCTRSKNFYFLLQSHYVPLDLQLFALHSPKQWTLRSVRRPFGLEFPPAHTLPHTRLFYSIFHPKLFLAGSLPGPWLKKGQIVSVQIFFLSKPLLLLTAATDSMQNDSKEQLHYKLIIMYVVLAVSW